MEAGIYARISDDREGRELGVDRQRKDCYELAERLGHQVIDLYVDNDISASTKTRKARPAFNRMLADARSGRIQVVIAYTSGRLTRRPREHEDLIDLATEHGVQFAYVRSPSFDLNTAAGRRVARTLAAQDAGEAEDISERVQRAALQRAERGEFHGGPRGYGITSDGRGLVDNEAEQIRGWAEYVLAGGKLHALAKRLNLAGVPTLTGAPWRPAVVRKILIHPRTAGLRIVDGAEYTTPHPAILDAEVWRAVVRVLADPGRLAHHGTTARLHLGVGLYRCHRDDRTVNTAYAHPSRARLYRCRTCWRSWRAEPLDEFIEHMTELALADEDRVATLLPVAADGGPDLAALRTEAKVITTNLETMAAEFATARGTVLAALKRGAKEAEVRLAEIENQLEAASRVDPAAGVLTAADPVAAFRALDDLGRRQAVVRRLMEVRLNPSPRGRRAWSPEFLGPSRWTGDTATWADHWSREV